MKKKIIGILLAAAVVGLTIVQVIPALAQTPQPLDHVALSPTSTTLGVTGVQQFNAQAYDVNGQPLSNVSYFWLVVSGGGTISWAGLFTATTPGTFVNTVEVVAVQNAITKIAAATVTVTGVPGALSRVTVIPATATLAPGATKQFTAQAYDVNGAALAGYTYTWSVLAGGGSINATSGLFTAGTATGTFTNTIQAFATNGINSGVGQATVTVSANPTPTKTPKPDLGRWLRLFNCYMGGKGFDNFLGGQWQVKNGDSIDTIKVVPGVVQAATADTSLTVLPNGQTAPITFALTADTLIQPKGITLAANDKVLVVSVNDQVNRVIRVQSSTTAQVPPGLKKHDDDKRDGKKTPAGWFNGKKLGWGK